MFRYRRRIVDTGDKGEHRELTEAPGIVVNRGGPRSPRHGFHVAVA
jgi:hypothetical protein